MIKIRRDDEISDVDGGWFRARWHYSFDTYHDPKYMQFGTMRVFNHDTLVPGAVWPMHPHRDIEGITWVVAGEHFEVERAVEQLTRLWANAIALDESKSSQ